MILFRFILLLRNYLYYWKKYTTSQTMLSTGLDR